MLAITTKIEHIGHWIKMRQSLARFSASVSSVHAPSWADFITTMVGFRVFGTHTVRNLSAPLSLGLQASNARCATLNASLWHSKRISCLSRT